MKWKDKILYHSQEIEEWFEDQETEAETEDESKPESELKSEPEKEPELNNEAKPHTEAKTDTKPDKYSEAAKELLENRLLTPQDLEREYQISVKTLANWRSQGKGPAYFKLGKTIRYRAEEIEKWIAGSKIRIYGNDD